ncbi:hypothetical protein BC629DRAFT_1447612 [Irpex lacteus]|nr:hypothetical protein BC629DRAFT_1447612 [Irpex lacteus]
MAHIGSVFLGDVQRQRILSTSTPPSSPPPPGPSPTQAFPDFTPTATANVQENPVEDNEVGKGEVGEVKPAKITPQVAFELRLRLLESIVLGSRDVNTKGRGRGKPLMEEVEDVQKKLGEVVVTSGSESLRWFVDNYDTHAHHLTPSFALSGILPPPSSSSSPINPLYESMSPEELEAYLAEMDPDIRAADRDLREIALLIDSDSTTLGVPGSGSGSGSGGRDVTAANNLGSYATLQPRLDKLVEESQECVRRREELERRVAGVMDRWVTTTDTLSQLFVAYDDTLHDAESTVGRLRREREERVKVGLAG